MAYIWMIGAMLAFASMGALTHGLRTQFGWEVIALARSVVILVVSGLLAVAGGVRLRLWRPGTLWIRSIAGTMSMLCVFYSFTRLPIAIVVTLLNLAPVWVAILSWPLLKHVVGKGVWLAILIGLAGVVLIQQPELAQGNFAILVPLGASLLCAIVMIALHRLHHIDHRAVVFHLAVVALFACMAIVLASGLRTAPQISHEPIAWLMLAGVGLASTTGQLLLTVAFASGSPAKLSVVGLTQVGFAMMYDVLVWGHEFDLLSLLGIVLVLAPAAWLLVRERRVLAEELGDG
jgi:drug/metabolite transporter (DMT)-like permease